MQGFFKFKWNKMNAFLTGILVIVLSNAEDYRPTLKNMTCEGKENM